MLEIFWSKKIKLKKRTYSLSPQFPRLCEGCVVATSRPALLCVRGKPGLALALVDLVNEHLGRVHGLVLESIGSLPLVRVQDLPVLS